MDKRYQVFVSSTYVDLIPERNEVMQALLELKCMPAGMELFPAANETQWNWIKRVIDESDYYILIVAGRYGTVSKDSGQSYTEMEYRYAVETSKPVIGFLHEDIEKLAAKHVEQSQVARRKLQTFRDLVGSRLCKLYSSPADLGAKVSRSLTQLREQSPAIGWIRSDVLPSSDRLDEILKLREENEHLRDHIYRLGLQEPETLKSLASGSEKYVIDYRFERLDINPTTGRFRGAGKHWDKVAMSWNDIFSVIGPSLIKRDDYWSIPRALTPTMQERATVRLQTKWPNSKFQYFRISSDDADAILLQLRALKLITVDADNKWTLTPYGDNYMTQLLAVPKGRNKSRSE